MIHHIWLFNISNAVSINTWRSVAEIAPGRKSHSKCFVKKKKKNNILNKVL